MADTLFDVSADILERHTPFNRLEARGTLRIALKAAGLEPNSVTSEQMLVVFDKLMPGELDQRAVSDSKAVCVSVAAQIAATPIQSASEDAGDLDEVFGRLGGD